MSDGPVFIVGCGRSGTSLLRRFLNQHPQLGIPLELLFIVDYLHAASHHPVERMTGLLVREPEVREWGVNPSPKDMAGCSTIAEAIDRLHRLYLAPRGKCSLGPEDPALRAAPAFAGGALPECPLRTSGARSSGGRRFADPLQRPPQHGLLRGTPLADGRGLWPGA